MRITLIGHSTVLLETGGKRILTDPYFGEWGNPVFGRIPPPALKREELLDVNFVLVSHHHFDHLDGSFFRKLDRNIPVYAPWWTSWITRLWGAKRVIGMRTWENLDLQGIRVTAVPAIHLDVSIGYVIQAEGKNIYFSGDTFFGQFMAEIARRFPPDVALLPVTTYRIPMTMGEQGAVKAAGVLSPKVIIPIHEGLRPRFPLLRTRQSPQGFRERLRTAGNPARVAVLGEGESLNL